MADLLVRGGQVVDGTGRATTVADVRIRGGVIAEVGPKLRPDGEGELDAPGALVTPGFIDTYTHFDPSLFRDSFCDPMPQHGVTTVLVDLPPGVGAGRVYGPAGSQNLDVIGCGLVVTPTSPTGNCRDLSS